MTQFITRELYRGPVQAVVLDWAGTVVDHGCMGPAAVFVAVFKEQGIGVSFEEARKFMGLEKKDHIRGMMGLASVRSAWQERFGRLPDPNDVDRLYERTAAMMTAAITRHADPMDGVPDMVRELRAMGIKIGSSTGYVREMMDVLVPLAREMGYDPDAVICSSDVPAGRPYPWMCYLNAIQLQVYPMAAMVKVGDTFCDIEEGLNAGMWTVGITRTGNEMGLSQADVAALTPEARQARLDDLETRFRAAGAHYVLEQTADLVPVIQEISQRLAAGELPTTAGSKAS